MVTCVGQGVVTWLPVYDRVQLHGYLCMIGCSYMVTCVGQGVVTWLPVYDRV